MKTTKLLSIIPTLVLALICLCAAAKNTGEPLLAELQTTYMKKRLYLWVRPFLFAV